MEILANNMMETELNRSAYDFSVGYNIIDPSNIINIHKYLIKKEWHSIKCYIYITFYIYIYIYIYIKYIHSFRYTHVITSTKIR